MVTEGPVGARPRWPDLVITLAIVGLVVVGIAALFGEPIRAWFEGDPPAPVTAPAAPGAVPTL